MARCINSAKSPFFSTAMAASVVPPGEVTRRRSSRASSGLLATMAPAPKLVIAARRSAVGAGNPKSRAAAASTSVNRK